MQLILKQIVMWVLEWGFMKVYRYLKGLKSQDERKHVIENEVKELKEVVNKPNPTDEELKNAAEKFLNS